MKKFKVLLFALLIVPIAVFAVSCGNVNSSTTISISPSGTHTFASLDVGYSTPPEALSVTIENIGDRPTESMSVTLSGASAESFVLSSVSSSNIAAGANATFTVQPKTDLPAGTHSATVSVSCANASSQTINLAFTVKSYGISLNVTDHTFTTQGVGYAFPPDALTVTVTNTGNQPTGALTLSFAGEDSEGFILSDDSMTNITAGGSATFFVRPKQGLAVGSYTETVSVSGENFTSQILNVSMRVGTYDILLSTAGNYFFLPAVQGYLTPPAAHTVTVHNTGTLPTGKLTVTLSGNDATCFSLSLNSVPNIAVGGTTVFSVQPKSGLEMKAYTATVTVSGDAVESRSFDVAFEVLGYGISISPSEVFTFDSIEEGQSPTESLLVTITNTGNLATGKITLTLGGTGASSFVLSKTTIQNLANQNDQAAFSIMPRVGLAVGLYTATVIISGTSFESEMLTVSFRVTKSIVVYFDLMGGYGPSNEVVLPPLNLMVGDPYGDLPEATRLGYAFLGWHTVNNQLVDKNTLVSDSINHVLVARWLGVPTNVTFNVNTISFFASAVIPATVSETTRTVRYRERYGMLPTPAWAGWTFEGWFSHPTAGTLIDETTEMTASSDHTLFAHWSPSVITFAATITERTLPPQISGTTCNIVFAAASTPTDTTASNFVYSAIGLPDGLSLDGTSNRIVGNVPFSVGTYMFSVTVRHINHPTDFQVLSQFSFVIQVGIVQG